MRIQFDSLRNPKPLTIVLATRDGTKLGTLPAKSVRVAGTFNSYFELSFEVSKKNKNRKLAQWDNIKDFKLVWLKEHDLWLEIAVQLKENSSTVKSVSAKSLAEAELSQTNLYQVEINTENDIAREDYDPTVFYDKSNTNASLLHRMLSKTPHYSIGYVEPSLHNIQRTFTFDGKPIYDALQEVAKEIGCYIDFSVRSDEFGKPKRVINVYDLKNYCKNCGTRGEFDVCPNCGKTEMSGGYGIDTGIFVSTKNLTDEIVFEANDGSIKNCFKLESGDDLMTATIANCNANGSPYIWCISDETKADMPTELVSKIDAYDALLEYYQNNHSITIDEDLVDSYAVLVAKYLVYDSSISMPQSPIVGFPALINEYYNTIDFSLLLESGLMPSPDNDDTTAQDQVTLLTAENLSPVAVMSLSSASNSTVSNSVLAMARILIDNTKYQIRINEGSYSSGVWTGNFIVTNYSDSEDYATSGTVSITITDNYEEYISQLLEKSLDDANENINDIVALFALSNDKFEAELHKYSLSRLQSFNDCCEACINILIENGAGSEATWQGAEDDIYNNLYVPYQEKLTIIQTEIQSRESDIQTIADYQEQLITNRNAIQGTLNFESYLGSTLWNKFIAYRREGTYSNSNYISDGLNNAELISRAMDFIETANRDLYDSSNLQHSITATLKNLLVIKEFEKLLDNFELGNFIRIECDDGIYSIRLLTYEIDYDNLTELPVTFSDVRELQDEVKDFNDIYNQTKSMATSYDNVMRQAEKGKESQDELDGMKNNGIAMSNMKIIDDANNQNYIFDSHGMLFRKYFPLSGTYGDEQLKIINSTIAITDDRWRTVKTAVGGHYYVDPLTNQVAYAYGINGEVLVGKVILGEQLGIYNEDASLQFNKSGLTVTNNNYTFAVNPNDKDVLVRISSKIEDLFKFTTVGNLYIKGEVHATAGDVGGCSIVDGTLTIDAANIKTGVFEEARIPKLSASKINVEDVITVGGIATNDGLSKGTTTIDGSCIKTGKIDTDRLNVSSIITVGGIATTDEIPDVSNFVTETQVTTITKDTVTTAYVNALGVTASSILIKNTNDYVLLSASGNTVNIGNFTVGRTSSKSYLYSGSKTSYDSSTAGVYLGSDGIGLGSGAFYVTSAGSFYSTDGQIGGWVIGKTNLYNNTVGLSSGTTKAASLVSSGVYSPIRIYAGGETETYTITTSGVLSSLGGALDKTISVSQTGGKIKSVTIRSLSLDSSAFTTKIAGIASDSEIRVMLQASSLAGQSVTVTLEYTYQYGMSRAISMILEDGSFYTKAAKIENVTASNITITSGSLKMAVNSYGTSIATIDFSGMGVTSIDYEGGDYTSGSSMKITSSTIKYEGVTGYGAYSSDIIAVTQNSDYSTERHLIGTWYIGALGSSTQVTSDRNKKNTIAEQAEIYSRIFDKLKPVTYKYNNGKSDRTHTGFIAQDIEDAVLSLGLTTKDFAAVCYDLDEDGNKINYGVRYEEIVSLNTYEIQKLKAENKELRARIEMLESK